MVLISTHFIWRVYLYYKYWYGIMTGFSLKRLSFLQLSMISVNNTHDVYTLMFYARFPPFRCRVAVPVSVRRCRCRCFAAVAYLSPVYSDTTQLNSTRRRVELSWVASLWTPSTTHDADRRRALSGTHCHAASQC